MTNIPSPNSNAVASPLSPNDIGMPRDVADLIRRGCQLRGRRGFRVAAENVRGQIFFEEGQVIHAEFGEDCGLRAVVEMLRAGPVVLEPWMLSWPSQPTMHLGSELMLSLIERGDVRDIAKFDTRVVRKVTLRADPPPVPRPAPFSPAVASPAVASPAVPSRSMPSRSMPPRVVPPRVVPPRVVPSEAAPPEATAKPAASVPPPKASVSGIRPVVRAEKRLSRAVVARKPPRAAVEADSSSSFPAAFAGEPLTAPASEDEPTTMVRIAAHGSLLAARGKHAERLADAAAFIHGLANLIASDLGRHGRANLHLHGEGQSLLVVRSEVNDIAAALGPTARLASLLSKVGLQ